LMPGGPIFGVLFFTSLALAGITSLLSILQVVIGAFQDKFGWSARRSSLIIGAITSITSVAFFATTSGLTTLEVVDAFTNNIGVIGGAIAMTLLAFVVRPRVSGLRKHLNATSSIKIPRIWEYLVGIGTPLVLGVMLVQALIDYTVNGYENYTPGDPKVLIFGWGILVGAVVFATVMTLLKWKAKQQHEPVINFVDRKVK
ncbi:sodium-dependent transporter, partial [Canibacter sp. lx-72]|nr:sodium-dependent transporter [Canibacter zhuwentaonis]